MLHSSLLSVAVLEAVLRAIHGSVGGHTRFSTSAINMSVLLQADSSKRSDIDAQVSLVTTFTKILQMQILGAPDSDPPACEVHPSKIDLKYVTDFVAVQRVALHWVMDRIKKANKSGLSYGGCECAACVSGSGCEKFPTSLGLSYRYCSSGDDEENEYEAGDLDGRMHGLRQLSAVLVLGLVRTCNFLLRTQVQLQGGLNPRIHREPDWLQVLEKQDAELAAVALQLLLLPFRNGKWQSIKASKDQEPRVWAKYAIGNLQGCLLPGCCHLGCINMEGNSEAALPTLKCGGCRRVSYCCVACQNAAWRAGGHREVCGKGEWAILNAD